MNACSFLLRWSHFELLIATFRLLFLLVFIRRWGRLITCRLCSTLVCCYWCKVTPSWVKRKEIKERGKKRIRCFYPGSNTGQRFLIVLVEKQRPNHSTTNAQEITVIKIFIFNQYLCWKAIWNFPSKDSKSETWVHRVNSVLYFGGRVFPIYISLHLKRVKGHTGGSLQPMEGRSKNLHNCPRLL